MKSQSWPRLDSLLFLLSLNNPFFPLQFPPELGDDEHGEGDDDEHDESDDEHGEGGGEHGEGGDDDDDGLFGVGAGDGDDDGWKEAVC